MLVLEQVFSLGVESNQGITLVLVSYNETPLIWSPAGHKNLAVLTGWPD